jgi:DNA-binding NarL/FixJ family response regulator
LNAPLLVDNERRSIFLRRRVLIADDNDSVRAVIRSFVEKQPGLEVCALTKDGVETVDVATALQPDLLILDVLMPGLNGVEVASVLKNKLPAAKSILFTLYGDAVRTLGPMMGANAVLTKSDGIASLLSTLRRLMSVRLEKVEQALALAAGDRNIDADHLEAISSDLNVPLTRCSRDLEYLWVSQEYGNWLQKPVNKIVGHSILNVMGTEAFTTLRHRFDQALSGQAVTYEADADYDKIGMRRICASYRPTLRPDGTVDGWLAGVQDVTNDERDEPDGPIESSSIRQVA